MAADLATLLPLEPTDALDRFIASCLCEGGIWESPRTSDGIYRIDRVFKRGPDELHICGRIWEIRQSVHVFWLEMKRDGASFAWFLYFDVDETSARRARNALDNHDRPDDIQWRAKLVGEAVVQDDALAIVPGSTRVLAPGIEE